jgi:hypothetical protein
LRDNAQISASVVKFEELLHRLRRDPHRYESMFVMFFNDLPLEDKALMLMMCASMPKFMERIS